MSPRPSVDRPDADSRSGASVVADSRRRGSHPASPNSPPGHGLAPARRRRLDDPSRTRSALLDAAQELMLEEGYAAVSSRRVASRAGVNAALVHYYFGTMDELFIQLFRRIAERSLERQARQLSTAQPLWGLWQSSRDQISTALLMEFNALASHRKPVQAEIAAYSSRFRRLQVGIVSSALERYGVDPASWPAVSVILLITGVARFMLLEEAFGVHFGHAETTELVERFIRDLEGERLPTPEDYLAQLSEDPLPHHPPEQP